MCVQLKLLSFTYTHRNAVCIHTCGIEKKEKKMLLLLLPSHSTHVLLRTILVIGFWFSFCFSFFALHCLPLECIEEFIFRIWDCSGCCTKTSSVNKWILDSVLVRNGYLNEAAGAVVVSCWIYIRIGNTGLWILKFLWISGEKKSFSISQSKTVSEWTFPLSEVEHIEKG